MPVSFGSGGNRDITSMFYNDGVATRDIQEAWYHDGTALRKVFSKAPTITVSLPANVLTDYDNTGGGIIKVGVAFQGNTLYLIQNTTWVATHQWLSTGGNPSDYTVRFDSLDARVFNSTNKTGITYNLGEPAGQQFFIRGRWSDIAQGNIVIQRVSDGASMAYSSYQFVIING